MISLDGILVEDSFVAQNIFTSTLGYMFRKEPHYSMIYFPKSFLRLNLSFHTFFCSFPLNFYFFNKHQEVIGLLLQIEPWGYFSMRSQHYESLLEVPTSSSWNQSLRLGTKLCIN